MDATQFVVQVFNGLVIGSTYVLVALGVTLIYGILRIINFAHGEIFMLGAYLAYFLVVRGHLNYWVTAGLVMMGCAILAVVLLNATMGYVQESRAEAAVAALRAMSAAQASTSTKMTSS